MIHILTGPVHCGKTTLLKKTADRLSDSGKHLTGFLSLSLWEDSMLHGYDLYVLKTGQIIPFIRRSGRADWPQTGTFFFIPEALEAAQRIVLEAWSTEICFVDELGPLELQGKGLWPAVETAVQNPGIDFLITVRDSLVEGFLDRLSSANIPLFNALDKNTPENIIKAFDHD